MSKSNKTKRISEERKTLETQLETAKKKKIGKKGDVFTSQELKDENIARMEAELGQLDEQSANLSAGLGGITEEEKASKIKRTQSKLDMMKSHLPNATAHQKEMWVKGVGGELGEIENCIKELEDVHDAVVLLDNTQKLSEKIYAFIIDSQSNLTEENLNKYLRKRLPNYMLPKKSYFFKKDFPRNENGKIDKKNLLNLINQK